MCNNFEPFHCCERHARNFFGLAKLANFQNRKTIRMNSNSLIIVKIREK